MRLSQTGKAIVLEAAGKKGWVDTSGDFAKAGEDGWVIAASMIAEPNYATWFDKNGYASLCSPKNLKKLLNFGEISENSFRYFCEAVGIDPKTVCQNEIQNVPNSGKSAGLIEKDAPFYSTQRDEIWVGRDNIRDTLRDKLKIQGSEATRILVIVGISGIGKTSLANKLIESLCRANFKSTSTIICSKSDTPLSFTSAAEQWLNNWGETISSDEKKPENLDRLILRILNRLQKQKYVLFIDAMEYILKGNEQTEENNFVDLGWAKFFERVLTAQDFASRVIVTSQTNPTQYEQITSNYWYTKPLKGLDLSPSMKLFSQVGINASSLSYNRPYLMRISNIYEGHPLALWIIAKDIIINFQGDAEKYWNEYKTTLEKFESLKKDPEIISEQDRYGLHTNKVLEEGVRKLIRRTFERLRIDSVKSYQLLLIGSAYRRPVPESAWFHGMIKVLKYSTIECNNALVTLDNRYLTERISDDVDGQLLGLHNLIRSIALELAQSASAKISHKVYDKMRDFVKGKQ